MLTFQNHKCQKSEEKSKDIGIYALGIIGVCTKLNGNWLDTSWDISVLTKVVEAAIHRAAEHSEQE